MQTAHETHGSQPTRRVSRALKILLAGSTEIDPGEGRPVLAASQLLFILLTGLMLLQFPDTFGYRAGDASGAFLDRLLAGLGPRLLPLSMAVFGLAAIWLVLCVFLDRAQTRLATPCQGSAPSDDARRIHLNRESPEITPK